MLPDKLIVRAEKDTLGNLVLMVDEVVIRAFEKEQERRAENRKLIDHLIAENPALRSDEVVQRWAAELTPLSKAPTLGALLPVSRTAAVPDWANQRIAFETAHKIRTSEDKYGYSQAYARNPEHLLSPGTVDLACMDPPYYDNVQYAELSDYFYVWQRRTLRDLYPDAFSRRLTNKEDEAVANPVRDGNKKKAGAEYERMMREIFAECHRVVKDNGIMTLMFTHKSQDA